MNTICPGDFTRLAGDYSSYRPDYAPSVLDAVLGLIPKPPRDIDVVDVGAGTGIWTRMIARRGVGSVIAVEPNDEMRSYGERGNEELHIEWRKGTGEDTGLPSSCCDLLSAASCFHWMDYDRAIREFARVLRPSGRFVALWNPRLIEANPLLVEIEAELVRINGGKIVRRSSGRSGIAETLTDRLWSEAGFDDVLYLEGRHIVRLSPARYVGAWRSVNDVQAQLGAGRFAQFLDFVVGKVGHLPYIEATYLTRAWAARRC